MLKRIVRKWLESAGYTVYNKRAHYSRDGLNTLHNDSFRSDPAFQAAYHRGIVASNGVDPQFEWRVHVALWVARNALQAPGDFVECGVNAGFISSAIMQGLDWNSVGRSFYLVDTFAGPVLSQYSEEEVARGRQKMATDAIAAGAYVTQVDAVRANFSQWGSAKVVQGAVPDILPSIAIDRVAFLHIDMNCAEPERAALEFFWDRLTPGAFVLLDDYAFTGHDCQKRAIDEAATHLGTEVLALPTGQGLIMRH